MQEWIKELEALQTYLEEKPWRAHPDFICIKEERKNRTLDPNTFSERIKKITIETRS